MPRSQRPALPDELFLTDVWDDVSGISGQTLDVMRSPAMLLSFAANHFTESASRYFKAGFDLGAVDWRLIFMFAGAPGSTAAHASKTIGIDKGAVSRAVQRLADLGLLVPGELHANGRSRGWYLTARGRRKHQALLKVALERQKELLAGFKADEVAQFCDFLGRFLHNVQAMRATD